MSTELSIEQRAEAIFGGSGTEATPKPVQAKPQETPESPQDASPEAVEPSGDTETTQEGTAPAVEETFEFDIEGEKFRLPKKLERSLMNQKHFTQETQALADKRRQVEFQQEQFRIAGLRQQFETSVSEELRQLAAFDAALEQAKSVDWASMTTDQILREKLKFDGWKDQREALQKGVDAKFQQFNEKQQTELKALHTKALETISKAIPNWNDATQKAIRDHAIADGYSEQELAAINDPRHALTLWKASQYDLLKSKATAKVTEVKAVKTTPTNPMPQHVKDKLAFRKQLDKTPPNSTERRKLVEARAAQIFTR